MQVCPVSAIVEKVPGQATHMQLRLLDMSAHPESDHWPSMGGHEHARLCTAAVSSAVARHHQGQLRGTRGRCTHVAIGPLDSWPLGAKDRTACRCTRRFASGRPPLLPCGKRPVTSADTALTLKASVQLAAQLWRPDSAVVSCVAAPRRWRVVAREDAERCAPLWRANTLALAAALDPDRVWIDSGAVQRGPAATWPRSQRHGQL